MTEMNIFNRRAVLASCWRLAGPANFSAGRVVDDGSQSRKSPVHDMSRWKKLCSLVGFIEEDTHKLVVLSDVLDVFKLLGVCNIEDIQVPRILAIVTSAAPTPHQTWILKLQDASGHRISAFASSSTVENHPTIAVTGSAILAENVCIFVSTPECERFLNIHDRCVVAVIPVD